MRLLLVAVAATLALTGCTTATDSADPGDAPSAADDSVRLLGQLTVAKAGSMKGYSRARFPHWRDAGKNCDVRDTVLKRDGSDVRLSGCNVTGGSWYSEYDERTLDDPSGVDIDHMVPLAAAWRTGAAEWDDDRRGDFANDLTRPQLLAVSASSNRAKGDQDPSTWKPANRDYWCTYAQSWIAVKSYWRLSVTADEKSALTDMLDTCPAGKP